MVERRGFMLTLFSIVNPGVLVCLLKFLPFALVLPQILHIMIHDVMQQHNRIKGTRIIYNGFSNISNIEPVELSLGNSLFMFEVVDVDVSVLLSTATSLAIGAAVGLFSSSCIGLAVGPTDLESVFVDGVLDGRMVDSIDSIVEGVLVSMLLGEDEGDTAYNIHKNISELHVHEYRNILTCR